MMKAYVLRGYGGPERLDLTTVDKPVPGDGEVLVRVRATSVQPYDWHGMRGEPVVARLMTSMLGLTGPRYRILGADIAGRVEAVGGGVTGVGPGADVFGLLTHGGFAEYAIAPERSLAPMPKNLSYEQAAAVPLAGMTALLALRDEGGLQPGQSVLVNGASGGVGTFAVQLAKAMGAEVTGVCSTRNVELVRSLGADRVIDYTRQDFTEDRGRYDLLVDSAGSKSGRATRRALKRDGTMVIVGGQAGRWTEPAGRTMVVLATSSLASQRVRLADVVGNKEYDKNLRTLTQLIEAGTVSPVIDRQYPFEKLPAAMNHAEKGRVSGKVIVSV